ncbi:MAG: hypothetical protein KY428_00620 [Bacteroidetes bacterium]|nr:hypothetical protein [Bacteroidota bacterium]
MHTITHINIVSVARYYLAVYRADQPYALRQQSFLVHCPEKLFTHCHKAKAS